MKKNLQELSSKLSEVASLLENTILDYLKETDDRYAILFDAMRYSTTGGGKRIRPFLTLAFCEMLGGSREAALPFACAVEMIHSYSLIHDDLPCMDNDDYRRGKLTCHRKFGEANALLAGDALLTYAFELLASNEYVSAEITNNAVKTLAKAAGHFGMVGGQQLDLIGEKKQLDMNTLVFMHSLKTGALIKASCILGCLAAGITDKTVLDDAETYAGNIGLAFQIIDDILDEGEEKTTFLTYLTPDEAYEYASNITNKANEAISKYQNNQTLSELSIYLLERKV